MPRMLLLGTGPLGKLTNPRTGQDAFRRLLTLVGSDYEPFIPDVCDYELRRELTRAGLTASERRLDAMLVQFGMIAITPAVWRQAARLWAETRNAGRPTANPRALDADTILAAEALANDASVLTMDPNDLGALLGPQHVIAWQAP